MLNKIFIFFGFMTIIFLQSCSITSLERISPEEKQKIINKAQNSKLIVLDIYHNNCSSCKLVEPVIRELERDYSQNKDVAFLKYDLSNPFTILDAKKIAKELGLENIYKSQRYSGVVLTIGTKKKQILDTLVNEYNISKYNDVIVKRLKDL